MNYISVIAAALAAIIAAACGNSDEFEIECDIEGLGTGQVEMTYYDGALCRVTAHGVDDRLTFRGSSSQPTLVTAFTLDRRELFTLIAENGDRLKVKMKLDDPNGAEIEGNEASEQLAAFRRENAALLSEGDRVKINEAVAKHIGTHTEDVASTAILLTIFDFSESAGEGDSLLALLKPEARTLTMTRNFSLLLSDRSANDNKQIVRPITLYHGRDSLLNFMPFRQSYGLLVINSSRKPEAVTASLRALCKEFSKKRLEIFEVSFAPDSARWRADIASDSARWSQGWLPGGAGNPEVRSLAITRLPLYIALDSTGKMLYRGASPAKAEEALRAKLK